MPRCSGLSVVPGIVVVFMTDEQYSRLAAKHLPGELAPRWTALLRPCVRLRLSVGTRSFRKGSAGPSGPGTGLCPSLQYGARNCHARGLPSWVGAQVLYIPQARQALLGDGRDWPDHPFDSDGDAGMEWGDVAALYWLIRPEDLAAHRFGQVPLTMQCM